MKAMTKVSSLSGGTRITPEQWDSLMFAAYSIIYMIAEAAAYVAVLTTGIYFILDYLVSLLSSFQVNIMLDTFWYSLMLSVAIIIARLWKQWQIVTTFITVPVGFLGIPKIQGKIVGNENHMITLTEGRFRALPKHILYGDDLFQTNLVPLEYPNHDVVASNINTNDGVFLISETTCKIHLVNPYKVLNLISLNLKQDGLTIDDINREIRARVEDAALEALNDATDDMSHEDIFHNKSKDATEMFMVKFNASLGKISQLKPKVPRFDGTTGIKIEFYFPAIGCNVSFNVKTLYPMSDDIRKALRARIMADAAQYRITAEGKGKAAAEAAIAKAAGDVYNNIYKKLLKNNMDPKTAAQKAALAANLYAHESVSEFGNSDGTPLEASKGLDIVRILAMAKALFGKFDDDSSSSKK